MPDIEGGTGSGGSGGVQYDEDTQHVSGDTGDLILVVRHDAGGSLAGTDGDYAPLQVDSLGRLRTVVSGGASGGTSAVDDVAFTVGTDSGTPMMALADDTTPDSVDEGDVGVPRMSLNRVMYQIIRDAAGNERGVNVNASNELLVKDTTADTALGAIQTSVELLDDTVQTTGSAVAGKSILAGMRNSAGNQVAIQGQSTNADDVAASAAGNHISVAAILYNYDGTTFDRTRGDATDGLLVNLGANNDVTVSGVSTAANQSTMITSLQLLDDVVATDGSAALTKLYQVGGTDGTNAQILSTNSSGHLNIADGGNVITVDGTVNAAQSGTWNITNVSGTVSLPTGASTSANQSTIITALQLLDDVVATDGSAALTKLYQVGGTDGTNAQILSLTSSGHVNIADGGNVITVDGTVIVTATNLDIRDLTHASDSVKIGDGTDFADVLDLTTANGLAVAILDGNGDQITSFGGGIQYTEGDTDASITGTAMLMEGATNTLLPVQGTVADGLLVNLGANNDVVVTNAGTFAVQESGGALTALQLLDNVVQTTGAAVAGSSYLVGIRNSAGNQTHMQGVSTNADDVGVVTSGDVLRVANYAYVFDGTTWDRAPGNSTDGTLVNLGANNDVTVTSGTITTVSTVTAVTTITNAVDVIGSVADDATTPGDPVMIGGSAVETDGTDPTSVSAEADVARVRTDRNRRLLVNDTHPNLWTANSNTATAQTDTELKATPGANLSLYITDIVVSTEDANTVKFEESTTTTKIPVLYLGAKGGAVMHFKTPIRITANTNFTFTSTVATNLSVMANGYIAP